MTSFPGSFPVLRAGVVPYLNMLPLAAGLEDLRLAPGDSRRLEPAGVPPGPMAAMLERGELDFGMVPAGAIFQRSDWRIAGRTIIGGEGPVKSVLILGSGDPSTWRRLHPDSHSRTSNLLARIVLARRWGVRPEPGEPVPLEGWTPPEPPPPGEAWVLIGTRALLWGRPWMERGGTALDLGEEWTRWTGLPFIYAAWAVRPDLEAKAAALGPWMEAIDGLKERNLARLGELLASRPRLAEEEGLDAAGALDYLTRNIRFDMTPAALEGLRRFHAEAAAEGLAPADWRPRFIEPD